jgi:predicted esterase
MCLNHGTTFLKTEAPSISPNLSGAELASSNGFIALMPDYIGYGSSSDIFHPYYDEKSSAAPVVDIINAARRYAHQNKISLNDKIFLAGYSEGGYVTLAAQKSIEANTNLDWKLTAVAAGAGGYDMQAMMQNIISTNYYSYPSYLAFIIKSYNLTYDWNYSMDHFFRTKYATFLNQSLDGNVGGSYINSQLTTRIDSLFSGTFYKGITLDSSEVKFNSAIKDNSLTDWTPSTPLKLYHGTSDEIIPYANSQITYTKLKANGAPSIDLIPISGGTHSSSFIPMIQYFFPWFEQLNAQSK